MSVGVVDLLQYICKTYGNVHEEHVVDIAVLFDSETVVSLAIMDRVSEHGGLAPGPVHMLLDRCKPG